MLRQRLGRHVVQVGLIALQQDRGEAGPLSGALLLRSAVSPQADLLAIPTCAAHRAAKGHIGQRGDHGHARQTSSFSTAPAGT